MHILCICFVLLLRFRHRHQPMESTLLMNRLLVFRDPHNVPEQKIYLFLLLLESSLTYLEDSGTLVIVGHIFFLFFFSLSLSNLCVFSSQAVFMIVSSVLRVEMHNKNVSSRHFLFLFLFLLFVWEAT